MTTGSLFSVPIAESEDCGSQGLHHPPQEGTLSSHPPALVGGHGDQVRHAVTSVTGLYVRRDCYVHGNSD